jgi:hypothetical protein
LQGLPRLIAFQVVARIYQRLVGEVEDTVAVGELEKTA